MQLADLQWLSQHTFTGLNSGEGLIYHVRDRRVRQKKPEDGGGTELLDEGADIKEALIIETEFGVKVRPGEKLFFGRRIAVLLESAPCSVLLVNS